MGIEVEYVSFRQRTKYKISGFHGGLKDVLLLAIDSEGTILHAANYRRYLDIPEEKVIGKDFRKLEPESAMWRAIQTKKHAVGERPLPSLKNLEVKGIVIPLYQERRLAGGVICYTPTKFRETIDCFIKNLNVSKVRISSFDLTSCSEIPLTSGKKLIGQSSAFHEILDLALKASFTDFNVLIRGETGVGKELVAELIHSASRRSGKPFVRVNCAAIPENLFESELFGYESGAFTGANKRGKPGKFELANGGTLFLDEIGDIPFNVQAKVLRAIQEKEIEKVGAIKPIPLDVRIIAATNRNLEDMVRKGTFRNDLYYRLNVVPISIPPLRERKEDITALTDYFLAEVSAQTGIAIQNFNEISHLLHDYSWPGNVRELENLVKYVAVLSLGNSKIKLEQLKGRLQELSIYNDGNVNSSQASNYVKVQPGVALQTIWEELEKKAIISTLRACRFNKTKASELLGISRQSLYQKAKKYSITIED